MCGIVGYAGREPIERGCMARMRDTMTHRGPDDLGLWISGDGAVGLAQRRLAVIDLSPGGHQPMADASGRVHVSFNGEIYNFMDVRRELEGRGHAFQTSSDTEVILAAYR
jgi:asparagine synthase (glutamine-hydrolysing)